MSVLLLLLLLLTACPGPRARVVVLGADTPDARLTVRTDRATQVLTEAYSTAAIAPGGTITPGTITPAQVQELFGAVLDTVPQRARLYTLPFRSGQATLDPAARIVVQEILADVASHPAVEVEIAGHTDTVGTLAANDALSLARAQMVRDTLVLHGLPAGFLRVIGRGEREPVVETADEVPNARNRRVEVTVR